MGGQGQDTYLIKAGDGWDVIDDSDGEGSVKYDGQALTGATRSAGNNVWRTDDDRITFTLTEETEGNRTYPVLVITMEGNSDGGLRIRHWQNGQLGITLDGAPGVGKGQTIVGDKAPLIGENNAIQRDEWGNIIPNGDEPGRADEIFDTPAADRLKGLDGQDKLIAKRGGNDVLEGGGGSDILDGGAGRDRLFGAEEIKLSAAIANGREINKNAQKGDWLAGSYGDDVVIGSTDNDYLCGGEGRDILVGGAGDDMIAGDDDYVATSFNWYAHDYGNQFDRLWGPIDVRPHSHDSALSADVIYGGSGNDFLSGLDGDDIIFGEIGDDTIAGDDGNDRLFGGDGNDSMTGDYGKPAYDSGHGQVLQGNDYLDGGAGDDWLRGEGGNDILIGGAGDDTLIGDSTYVEGALHGNDTLRGGDGHDTLVGQGGEDDLSGGNGDDTLLGDSGDTPLEFQKKDLLDGGAGDDSLFGFGGDDRLIGGKGNDTLVGGAGKDTYVFHIGDGIDTVIDTAAGTDDPESSILELDEGYNKENIKFRIGSLYVDLGNGDGIHFENFNQLEPLATPLIGEIRFANGDVMSYADILAQGFDIDGTDGDDDGHDSNDPAHHQLLGTGVTDRIRGFAGNDVLAGFGGNDILDGGAGTDVLDGGDGNDLYLIGAGESQVSAGGMVEVIVDASGEDTVRFGTGVDPAGLRVSAAVAEADGSPLLVIDSGTGDRLTVANGLADTIEHFEFADGTRLDTSELVGRHALQTLIDDRTGADAPPSHFYGGKNSDTITANGHAQVSGGLGNDTLTLNGDGNTVRYRRGDGEDSIVAHGQRNELRLAGGVTAADVKWVSGGLVLQIGDNITDRLLFDDTAANSATAPFERIVFDDGSFLSFSELLARGADITGTDGDDRLAGTPLADRMAGGAGNDTYVVTQAADVAVELADNGIDTVEAAVDYALGENVENLTLTGGATSGTGNALDNRLTGNAGNNVLDAGAGDDFLDGRAGDDLLLGGEGADTYLLEAGSGHDIVRDGGAKTNVIQLGSGLGAVNLRATWEGNDLLLSLRGSGDQVRLEGYKAGGQQWQLKYEDGSSEDLSAFLARPDSAGGASVAQLWAEAKLAARVEALGSMSFAQNVGDMTFETWRGRIHQSNSSQTMTTRYVYFNGNSSTVGPEYFNSSAIDLWEMPQHDLYYYDALRTESNDASINVSNGSRTDQYRGSALVTVAWGASSTPVVSDNTQVGYIYSYSTPDPRTGGPSVIGYTYTSSHLEYSSRTGNVLRFDAFPAGWNAGMLLPGGPQVVASTVTNVFRRSWVSEVVAGDAGNYIWTINGMNDLVDGGAGRDTLLGDEHDLLYGNDGDDDISGSTGSQTLIGGRGADTLDGGNGGDVYRLLNEDSVDTISDSGGEFETWRTSYYQSLGINNIYYRESYGGKWVITETGEFNSYAEAVSWVRREGREWILQELRYVPPLPPLPEIHGNDYGQLEQLYGTVIQPDRVIFADGVTVDDLLISGSEDSGYMKIRLSDGTGVDIKLAQRDDQIGTGVEYFEFSNGSFRTIAQMVAVMNGNHSLTGTEAADTLVTGAGNDSLLGLGGNDVLSGGAGDDVIDGGAGDDLLTGGRGSDLLRGGSGSNRYALNVGDGQDTVDVVAPGGVGDTAMRRDRLQFGDGVTAEGLRLIQRGDDLVVAYGTTDAVTLSGWFVGTNGTNWEIGFADGRVADLGLDQGTLTLTLHADDGMVTTVFYGQDGVRQRDRWSAADGRYGADVFSADGSFSGTVHDPDGAWQIIRGDGQGSQTIERFGPDGALLSMTSAVSSGQRVTVTQYDADGARVSDTWEGPGESSGSDTFYADGSSEGVAYFPNGTSSTYANDGLGTVTTHYFDAQGLASGSSVMVSDGAGGGTGTRYAVDGALLGSSVLSVDGAGNRVTTNFDVDGVRVDASWIKVDGSFGQDYYYTDGSSEGTSVTADGLNVSYQNYGQGNDWSELRSAQGAFVSDSWHSADGGNGSNQVAPDGSSQGVVNHADGSVIRYTDDGHGNVLSSTFDTAGKKSRDDWFKSDGSSGFDVYNADGSSSGQITDADRSYRTYYANGKGWSEFSLFDSSGTFLGRSERFDDGHGNVTITNFDRGGILWTRNWIRSDGSHGSDSYLDDNFYSGVAYQADGSYLTYRQDADGTVYSSYFDKDGIQIETSIRVDDGDGNVTTEYFNLDDAKIRDIWVKADGTSGSDYFNADGSSHGRINHADGSYELYTNDGLGNIQTEYFDHNTVSGTAGGDVLVGTNFYDTIYGLAGDDVISGGAGNDALVGGEGNDAYVFGRGDGADWIDESGDAQSTSPATRNVIRYTAGVAPEDIDISIVDGDLAFAIRGSDDVVYYTGSFEHPPQVEFADGTVWSQDFVRSSVENTQGSAGADWLVGTMGNDVINGAGGGDTFFDLAGDDVLIGGDGADKFNVGSGNNVLRGAEGSDLYSFGVGHNVIVEGVDDGEVDTLAFDATISPEQLRFERYAGDGDDLLISVEGASASTLIENWFNPSHSRLERFYFAGSDSELSATAIDRAVWQSNVAPHISDVEVQHVAAGTPFRLLLSELLQVADPDGDRVSFDVSGDVWPDWLSFDPETGVLSGAPALADVQDLGINVTVMDADGLAATGSFSLSVYLPNVAPVVNVPIGNLNVLEDTPFVLEIPAGTFSDANAGTGDSLVLSATLANGDPLPDWLSFDAKEWTFSGTPANGDVGSLQLRITATDSGGLSVSDSVVLSVGNVNDAPTVLTPIPVQLAIEDTPFRFTLPTDAFADVDAGDALSFSATQADGSALPGWLAFDAGSRSFRGTPANDAVGLLGLKVTATDQAGASVSAAFALEVANVNDAPIVANNIGALSATEGAAFRFVVPDNAFLDVDAGDTTVLSATLVDGSDLPPWLVFDSASHTFSGTPAFADAGALTIRLTATDRAGESACQTVTLAIEAVTGITVVGTAGNDTLTGTRRNDTLDGAAGRDRMAGGAGDDTYYLDNAGDAVVEFSDEGADTEISSVSLTLAANVEKLVLSGTGNLAGTGNVLDNVLIGNSGANSINGGPGADTMIGGAGNDTYYVDNSGDVVTELAGEGTDRVISSVTYSLGENVENLTLSGMDAISATGNDLSNSIVGNAAANVLSGLAGNDSLTGGDSNDVLLGGAGNDVLNGGAGADLMAGGADNDTYYVDDAGDVVTEQVDEGADRIISTTSYALSENVESLILSGTLAISGSGNALANTIVGNAADNVIDGCDGNDSLSGGDGNDTLLGGAGGDVLNGGLGADIMAGGGGNDTYYVDCLGDSINELFGEGTDRVVTTISYVLGDNLENLTLSGTDAINGTGNELANSIIGNSASNILSGLGGNDSLIGGASDDTMSGGGWCGHAEWRARCRLDVRGGGQRHFLRG